MKKLIAVFMCFALCIGSVCAEGNFTAEIANAHANPGDTVNIDVVFQNNPGLVAALFSLEYDRERLSLIDAKDGGILQGAVFSKSTEDYPYKMVWNSASTTNFTNDGVLITLTFRVKDNAKGGNGFVSLQYNPNDVFDVDLNNVDVTVVGGGITVNAKSYGGGGYLPSKKPQQQSTNDEEKADTEEVLFRDLTSYPWAKESVERLARKGIIKGTGDGTFSPQSFVSRADFAIMLTRAMGIELRDGEQFSDVDENKYYAGELKAAKSAGIILGIGDNKFNPDGKITRQDMMVMLCRALEKQGYMFGTKTINCNYTDLEQISPYAKDAVITLINQEIIKGSDNRINPRSNATRAEVAVMLDRVFNQ